MNKETTEVETSVSHRLGRGILDRLKKQKESCLFTDVTIVIDQSEFSCHRVILAASSEFFRVLFCSKMKEDLQGRVELKDISPQIFSEILKCVYSGTNILNEQDIIEIWHAANQLQILFLISECELYLKRNISAKNVLAIYLNSKLLDSKEVMRLSWAYILQNFESIRKCKDILMFSVDDMKSLVSSQDLNARIEDDVLETILLWTANNSTQTMYEASCDQQRITETDMQRQEKLFEQVKQQETNYEERNKQETGYEERDGQVKQQEANYEERDKCNIRNEHEKRQEYNQVDLLRADHLVDLIKVSRFFLTSGKFLLSAMKNDQILNNKKAQKLLEEAIAYQLQPDRRHDYYPATAIHRSCSKFESVIVGINQNSLACWKKDGKFYQLKNLDSLISCAVCFNDKIYACLENQRIVAYVATMNMMFDLPKLTFGINPVFIVAVRNCLYVVACTDGSYMIGKLNLMDTLYTSDSGQWEKVGSLLNVEINIPCATVIQDKILFVGSNKARSETKIVVFDTTTKQSQQLHDILPIYSSAVSFWNSKESFILQSNGALYRVKHCPDSPFIKVNYQTMLWDFERELRAAVLFNDKLLVFGPKFSENISDNQWELGLEGVFKCVQNICCESKVSCFMPASIPKVYVTKEIDLKVRVANEANVETSGQDDQCRVKQLHSRIQRR